MYVQADPWKLTPQEYKQYYATKDFLWNIPQITPTHLHGFHKSADIFIVLLLQDFLANWVDLLLFLTIRTNIDIHVIGLHLGYAHTPTVEPVLAPVTANVKPVHRM